MVPGGRSIDENDLGGLNEIVGGHGSHVMWTGEDQ